MHIDIIEGAEALERLRPNWEAVYASDPEGQYFMSRAFLSTYMRRFKEKWFVLAARSGGAGSTYCGFFPLRSRGKYSQKTGTITTEINLAGNYMADYSGMIVEPAHHRQALTAFARHLRQMGWAKVHLENLRMSERRQRVFMEALQDKRFTMTELPRIDDIDGTDHMVCPYVDLPASFDAYLDRQVGSSTRQKIRRFLRKVEGDARFSITETSAETVERDIDALLGLWRTKWEPRKGSKTAAIINSNRVLLRHAFQAGDLKLPVLWDGGKAVGALAFFVDRQKRHMLFHMAGRDETYEGVPTGIVLHGYAIRWAIDNGFTRYDFMRGDEPYKFTFGAKSVRIHSFLLQTQTRRNLDDIIDPAWLPSALDQATNFHKDGALDKAERIYRQILLSEPRHSGALNGIGQLLAQRGDSAQAIGAFRRLVDVAPTSVKAAVRLALALQGASRHHEAIDAFRAVLALDPDMAEAKYSLARNLAKAGSGGEAVILFRQLLTSSNTEVAMKARRQITELQRSTVVVAPAVAPRDAARPSGPPRSPDWLLGTTTVSNSPLRVPAPAG